ncbi:MAG: hypothetical protein HGA47_10855 [Zoogloea sp.]|nr:hypothetical protein [Zoogloea sp.]
MENLAMLLFVGGYSMTSSAGVPVTATISAFGMSLFLAISALTFTRLRRKAAVQ